MQGIKARNGATMGQQSAETRADQTAHILQYVCGWIPAVAAGAGEASARGAPETGGGPVMTQGQLEELAKIYSQLKRIFEPECGGTRMV